METWAFLAFLFLFTMLSWLAWAWVSKRRTEKKLADPNAPKSSLAKDGPGPNPVTAPRGEMYRAQTEGVSKPHPEPHPTLHSSPDDRR